METLILVGLAAAILFTAVVSLFPKPVQPPQIIYVQTTPAETSGTGCLPILILVTIILVTIILV